MEGLQKTEKKLEKINNKSYQSDALNFRNKHNHRYSPKIEMGISLTVERGCEFERKKTYSFVQTQPLKIEEIIKLLKKQHEYCCDTFDEYKKLVFEQLKAFGVI